MKDGRMDRQTLFHRTLSANAGGPINIFEKGKGTVRAGKGFLMKI